MSALALTFMVCGNVLARAIFRRPFGGVYECVGLFAVLITSLAISETELADGHISVGIVVDLFSERTRAAIDIVIKCLSMGVFAMLACYSFMYARELRTSHEVSQTLAISFSPFVYIMAISLALMCLALFVNLCKSVERVVKKK